MTAASWWRWWRAEIAALRPAWLRRAPGLALAVDAGGAALRRRRGSAWREEARLPAEGALPRRLVRRLRAAGAPLALVVPEAWVLRRALRLPEAAAARLDAVLAFELEAQLPLSAEEILWTARVLRPLPELGRIEVEVAVLPRHLVAPLAARLREAGVTAALAAMPAPGAWPAIALDPLSPPRRSWQGVATGALAGVSAALALHLLVADHQARDALARGLEARAAEARAAATRAQALEAEVAELRARLAAAAGLRARPPAVAVLEEAARRLPDGAWLTELRLSGEALVLTGHAAAPDALVAQLGASPLFREVRFAAPVTRGGEAADRVQLSLRVVLPDRAEPAPLRTVSR
ncbi:PilN domain-containing protein [Falsiroseomonas sp. CW058]|uniref:PilN domain-containing protein n=1 Tax=Falsiroseomonas sp. CW058 TaxID=3388664 RepID=UPI003D31187C